VPFAVSDKCDCEVECKYRNICNGRAAFGNRQYSTARRKINKFKFDLNSVAQLNISQLAFIRFNIIFLLID